MPKAGTPSRKEARVLGALFDESGLRDSVTLFILVPNRGLRQRVVAAVNIALAATKELYKKWPALPGFMARKYSLVFLNARKILFFKISQGAPVNR